MSRDLRFAFRMLARSPAFTAVAILSLALGIGANTAIFSLINAVVLRPIPVEQPSRLVSVFITDERNPGQLPLSHLNWKDLRDRNEVFTGLPAVAFTQMNWSQREGAEQVPVQVVSGDYFAVLGVAMRAGRALTPEDDRIATPVAVVSHGFWERSLGGAADAVGRTLTLNRQPFTIVGVAPRGFTGTQLGGGPALWVPMSMHDVAQPGFTWYEQRRGLFLLPVGRLRPGVSIEQADANLRTIFAQLEQAYPTDNRGRSAGAVSLVEARLNPGGRGDSAIVQLSTILMAVVGLVLLIACANIANLLLARAARRRKEIALRLALGAERWRLIRQLLTESVLLAVLGGGVGVLLAQWLLSALTAANLQLPLPIAGVDIDLRVLTFTALLALASGLLFGLVPALQSSRPDVLPALKNEIVPSSDRAAVPGRFTLRQGLVVAQVAMSLVSLVAAGLFLRSLNASLAADPGFETRGVLVLNLNLGREGYTEERGRIFYERLAERVGGIPGVRFASVAQNPPLGGGFLRSVFPEGADTTTQDRVLVQVNSVGPDYLDTLGIPVVEGRSLTRDDRAAAPRVVVVNETMARRFWPNGSAVGRRFTFFGDDTPTTVVGIARDSTYNAVAEEPIPFIYQPLSQNYTPAATLHVRTDGQAATFAPAVRAAVQELDPTLSVFNVRTLDAQVSDSLGPLRINVIVLAAFGALALLLASIGLYGVAAHAVTQRTREIGVRMALGAAPRQVLAMVLRQTVTLVLIGIALGLVGASLLTPLLPAALLPNVSRHDPATLTATSLLLGTVALLASWLPARRATRIDPLIALRTE